MSFKNCWTISSSYAFQVPKESSQRRCCFPRLLYCDLRCSQTCFQHSQTCCRRSQVLPGAPQVLSGALRFSPTYHNHFNGTPVPVIRDSSNSEARLERPPRVLYSPEIDHLSLHSTSSQTLLVASSDWNTFCWWSLQDNNQHSGFCMHIHWRHYPPTNCASRHCTGPQYIHHSRLLERSSKDSADKGAHVYTNASRNRWFIWKLKQDSRTLSSWLSNILSSQLGRRPPTSALFLRFLSTPFHLADAIWTSSWLLSTFAATCNSRPLMATGQWFSKDLSRPQICWMIAPQNWRHQWWDACCSEWIGGW